MIQRILLCTVRRHCTVAGGNPVRQLSFQPVVIGSIDGGNELDGNNPIERGHRWAVQ